MASTGTSSNAEDLLHCIPPTNLSEALTFLRREDANDSSGSYTSHCPVPFAVIEPSDGKPFLACSYNEVKGRHRSPWDNRLYPKKDNGAEKQQKAVDEDWRSLETTFNEVWKSYATLYYGHEALVSVYLKSTNKGEFEGMFGIKKVCSTGSWDSASHVVVADPVDGECLYRIETTVQCIMDDKRKNSCGGQSTISAIVSKTTARSCKLPSIVSAAVGHMENIGTIIEANEIDLRSNLEKVLIPKNQESIENILASKRPNVQNEVNPLMSMVMNSEMLKRRLANQPS